MIIYKYKLAISLLKTQDVTMPVGASLLHLGLSPDDQSLAIWALVDETVEELETRKFVIVGTGQRIPDHTKYIGTTQQGPFMWHLFEVVLFPLV